MDFYSLSSAKTAVNSLVSNWWRDEKRHLEEMLDFSELAKKHPDLGFEEGCLAEDDDPMLEEQLKKIQIRHNFIDLYTVNAYITSKSK